MVGIDIGGTFTDVAATEVASGALHVTKVPSTPADPSQAIADGLARLFAERPELRAEDIRFFGHGTTVATNALLEQRGARAGLLITAGLGAIYELRGGTRPGPTELIDPFYQKPAPLVPQRRTLEIGGRLAADGAEVEPLDEAAV